MKIKKLPTLLTDKELSEALETSTDSTEKHELLEYSNDVVPFLSKFNIVPGPYPVKKELLYKLYKLYSSEPLTSFNFNLILGLFLCHYKNKSGSFYRINNDAFLISSKIFNINIKRTVRKTNSNTYRKHFEEFLSEKNITQGETPFKGLFLHEIYKKFCAEKGLKRHKIGRINFYKFLKIYFKSKRIGPDQGLFYLVNKETTSILTEEEKLGIKETGRSKKSKNIQGKERME